MEVYVVFFVFSTMCGFEGVVCSGPPKSYFHHLDTCKQARRVFLEAHKAEIEQGVTIVGACRQSNVPQWAAYLVDRWTFENRLRRNTMPFGILEYTGTILDWLINIVIILIVVGIGWLLWRKGRG